MPPKPMLALELVLKDLNPDPIGRNPVYRVAHRNGTMIEGKLVSVGEEAVQFNDSRLGLVEIEKGDIACIDKKVAADIREKQPWIVGIVFSLVTVNVAVGFVWRPGAELEEMIFIGLFALAVVSIVALRWTARSWEPVYPPPETVMVDDQGRPIRQRNDLP